MDKSFANLQEMHFPSSTLLSRLRVSEFGPRDHPTSSEWAPSSTHVSAQNNTMSMQQTHSQPMQTLVKHRLGLSPTDGTIPYIERWLLVSQVTDRNTPSLLLFLSVTLSLCLSLFFSLSLTSSLSSLPFLLSLSFSVSLCSSLCLSA